MRGPPAVGEPRHHPDRSVHVSILGTVQRLFCSTCTAPAPGSSTCTLPRP